MRIITVRGIGEAVSPKWNLLTSLEMKLPGWKRTDLTHQSSYGPVGSGLFGQSFNRTIIQSQDMLSRELDRGPAVVIGYSAGAAGAGHFAANGGHSNMVALGLVADPFQPEHVTGDGKSGIAGSRDVSGVPVCWVSNPKDIICQSPTDSMIRPFARLTADMSLSDLRGWLNRLALQGIGRQGVNGALGHRALRELSGLRGYLTGGEHGAAYDQWMVANRTRIDGLAEWVRGFE